MVTSSGINTHIMSIIYIKKRVRGFMPYEYYEVLALPNPAF